RIYLLIEQNVEIDFTDYWSNYDASFAYWVHLDLTNGVVTGHVQRWSYWVEAGAFASVIAQILEPNIKLGMSALNSAVNGALGVLSGNINGIYYLPGNQVAPVATGFWDFHWQDTDADVTIVFET